MIYLCSHGLCQKPVDTCEGHSKIGDRVFCSAECATDWALQNARLSQAAFPFGKRPKVKKYPGYISQEDPGDDNNHLRPPEK